MFESVVALKHDSIMDIFPYLYMTRGLLLCKPWVIPHFWWWVEVELGGLHQFRLRGDTSQGHVWPFVIADPEPTRGVFLHLFDGV